MRELNFVVEYTILACILHILPVLNPFPLSVAESPITVMDIVSAPDPNHFQWGSLPVYWQRFTLGLV